MHDFRIIEFISWYYVAGSDVYRIRFTSSLFEGKLLFPTFVCPSFQCLKCSSISTKFTSNLLTSVYDYLFRFGREVDTAPLNGCAISQGLVHMKSGADTHRLSLID